MSNSGVNWKARQKMYYRTGLEHWVFAPSATLHGELLQMIDCIS